MSDSLAKLNSMLGPLLGFLFTAGTLVFIALNAHRTARPVDPTAPAAQPPRA